MHVVLYISNCTTEGGLGLGLTRTTKKMCVYLRHEFVCSVTVSSCILNSSRARSDLQKQTKMCVYLRHESVCSVTVVSSRMKCTIADKYYEMICLY